MRRYLISGVLALLSALILAMPASAGIGWCKSDPLVSIDGNLADIFVSAPLDAPLKVTGPTKIVVSVPVGVKAELILADLGFGKGEEVTFEESSKLRKTATGIEVQVAVYVPATDSTMPVKVEFAPHIIGILKPASAQGTANTWVVLKTKL